VPVWLPVFVAVMVPPVLSVLALELLSVAEDLLSVAEGEALSCVLVGCAVPELGLSCRTINESRSGSHLGQGHAAVRVVRKIRSIE